MRTYLSYAPSIVKEAEGMNSSQGTGHKILRNPANGRTSEIPTHGGAKQLGTGLRNKIMKDLGLK